MEESRTYTSSPHFVDAGDPHMINGWNSQLEAWLEEMQRDTTSYYLMLTATARVVRIWKWVFLITYAFITACGITVTAITLNLAVSGIWLPILTICIAVVGAFILIMAEAFGFNEWCKSCRDSAAEFITLGRRIESQKRIARKDRLENGIKFSNAASMQFEELRGEAPYVLGFIRKRYLLQVVTAQPLVIPEALLPYHAQEPVGLKHEDPRFEVLVQGRRPSLSSHLQDLLHQRMTIQQEHDALSRYEDYVRDQYSVASDAVLRRTASK